MNWKLFSATWIAVVFLTGCATEPAFVPSSPKHYQEMLSTWRGKDINDLIYSWGPPTSTFTMPNTNKMFTWDNVKIGPTVTSAGGSSVYLGYGISVGSEQISSFTKTWDCHTTAIASSSGTILTWMLKGNSCVRAYTQEEYDERLNSNRKKLESLAVNAPVTLRFFPGLKDSSGSNVDEVEGFLKTSDASAIMISDKKTGFFAAERTYQLKFIEDVFETAVQQKQPVAP